MTARYKWFKLDAETWLSDPKLRMVSATAKGIWIDLICMCHLSEKYGFLIINDSKMNQKQIKNALKLNQNEMKHFNKLVEFGIIRQDEEGFFYCHKLLKDKDYSEQQAEHGRKRGRSKPKGKPEGNPQPEQEQEREIDKEKDNIFNNSQDIFMKPTLEELKKFVSVNKLNLVDVNEFYLQYEANGWMVGKNKMESWEATLRGWQLRKGKLNAQNQSSDNKNGESKQFLNDAEKQGVAIQNLREKLGETEESNKGGVNW